VDFSGGSPAGLTVTVFTLSFQDDDLLIGDQVAASLVEDETRVAVPVPDESELFELSPEAPGLLAGLYGAVAFSDDDSDGLQDEGDEAIHGVPGDRSLIYLGGTIQDYLGQPAGFFVYYENKIGDTIFANAELGLNLQVFDPSRELTVGGTSANLPGGGSPPVALVPLTGLRGLPGDPLADNQSSDAWSFTLSGEPPSDHLVDVTDDDGRTLTVAWEVPLAYGDTDNSGGFTLADNLLGVGCDGSNTTTMLYVYPPTYLTYAFYFTGEGLNIGWSVLGNIPGSDDSVVVEDPTAIVIDPTACSLN
jgi:hypothetical protein